MTQPNLIFIRRARKSACPVRVFQKRPYAKAAAIGMHRAGLVSGRFAGGWKLVNRS